MLQKHNNHFDIEELNILHCEKVANLIYRSYTDANLIWHVLPSKREETKTAIIRRIHKSLNSNLSHVAVQNNKVVACVISIDTKNLESLLQEEKSHNLPEIFKYLNRSNSVLYDQLIENNNKKQSQKSAFMLFSAVEPEFAQSLTFFNLIQWNIEQLLLSGYKKYYGIISNPSRFLNLSFDVIKVLSTSQTSDKEHQDLDKYQMSLVCYDIKPLLPRASL